MNNNSINRLLTLIGKKTDTIGIELTTYCPLNCVYCTRHLNERKDRHLSWDDFILLKSKLDEFKRVVICGIGEPMVYEHIYGAVNGLKQRVVIITSGTVPIDFERLGKGNNIEVVIFSVDQPHEEGMKSIAGNYNWTNLLKNLKEIRKYNSIFRMINCTVNRYNYRNIPEMVRFASENKLQAISFIMDIHRDEREDINSEIFERLERGKELASKGKIILTHSFDDLKCICWDDIVPYLNLHGEVFPCCYGVNSDFVLGNIFENDFASIWNGQKYESFRSGEFCKRCPIYQDKSDVEGNIS